MNNIYQENISVEEINNHDLSWFKGEIVLLTIINLLKEFCPGCLRKKFWDLIQKPDRLSGKDIKIKFLSSSCQPMIWLVFFRINKIGIPKELIDILADPEIIKVGVAVHDDLRFLKK